MEKKIIKLISPKMSKRPMDSHFKVQMSPPLCLLVLAGLTPQQYEVYVEDENVEKLNLNDQPDLVGITVKADTRNRSVQIAEVYRSPGQGALLWKSLRPDQITSFHRTQPPPASPERMMLLPAIYTRDCPPRRKDCCTV